MKKITIAVCTYNRAHNLPNLVAELRKQTCPIPYEILFIVNNSTDNTIEVLEKLARQPGAKLRFTNEPEQGIAYARNRAITECMDSDYMLFIDDDELPSSIHMVEAAAIELEKGEAQCVGGKVTVDFGNNTRPKWLVDELLGFYAEINYGDKSFVIHDESTPIWTSIIAYDMRIFHNKNGLCFDVRYNRQGGGIGGGEDVMMFRKMLELGIIMKYLPDMGVLHHVEPWRMNRCYFLRLHFISGRKIGQYELPDYTTTFFGVPPFLITQFVKHLLKSLVFYLKMDKQYVRQWMNAAHSLGMIYGQYLKWKQPAKNA